MQDLASMDVLKGHAYLYKPLHDIGLGKVFILSACFLNSIGKISCLTKLHNNDQLTLLDIGRLVLHNVRVIKIAQQHRL